MKRPGTGRLFVILLLLIVSFQVLYPLVMLLYGSLRDVPPGQPGHFSLKGYIKVYSDPETYVLLFRTFWLAVVRTVLTVGTALFLAWAVTRTNIPFRRFLEWSILFIFFMPILPRILAWILLLSSRTGFVNQLVATLLPFAKEGINIYSYWGIIFMGVLLWAPVLFILLVPAFRAMDASLEESSRMSGASLWKTLWHIDLPLLTPALLAATALAFIKMMESFVVEAMLGVQANIYVLSTKIYDYIAHNQPPEYPPGMALSVCLVAITAIAVALQWKILGQKDFTTMGGKGYKAHPVDLGKWKYVVFFAVLLFVLLNLFLPLGTLVWGSFMRIAGVFSPNMYTLDHYKYAFKDPILMRSIWNTIIMGVMSATLGMILCTFIGYVVTKTDYKEKHAIDIIAWIPWGIPGIVISLGFLWAYIIIPMPFGITLYGSLALMTIVFINRGLPLGTKAMTSTIIQISDELEESSRVHGASWIKTFFRILIPLVSPGFLAGWLLLFTFAVKDLDVVILLYGPRSYVMSTVIYDWWTVGHFEEAIVLGLLQTALITIAYLCSEALGRRIIPSAKTQ
jgi:iron(III) transport system permease protein